MEKFLAFWVPLGTTPQTRPKPSIIFWNLSLSLFSFLSKYSKSQMPLMEVVKGPLPARRRGKPEIYIYTCRSVRLNRWNLLLLTASATDHWRSVILSDRISFVSGENRNRPIGLVGFWSVCQLCGLKCQPYNPLPALNCLVSITMMD